MRRLATIVLLTWAAACADDSLRGQTIDFVLPSVIDFGDVVVGTLGEQPFAMQLDSGGSIQISAITPRQAQLAVADFFPHTLRNGESSLVTITWLPLVSGTLESELEVHTSPLGLQLVRIIGEAVDPPPCDDGNPCTDDSWSDALGHCTAVANNSACDDGDDCTTGDLCQNSACRGQFDATVAPHCQPTCDPNARAGSALSGQWYEELWSSAADDIWAVGTGGTTAHFDGSSWRLVESCATGILFSIHGVAGDDLWAAGDAGTIVHWNGSYWSDIDSGTSNRLWGIFAVAHDDVWAVGDAGTVLHFDGQSFAPVPSGVVGMLYGAWGNSGSNVWVVGDDGVILHWNGSALLPVSSGVSGSLFAVRGSGSDAVWAVGNIGQVLRWDGASWGAVAGLTAPTLFTIWTSGPDDVWFGGQLGQVLHYGQNSGVTDHTLSGAGNVYGLWGLPGAGPWLGSSSGMLRQWNGSAWTSF